MIQLTIEGMREIFPKAPADILEAFVRKQDVLDRAGITATRTRLSYFFSNIEHECAGFTIPNLTESTRYTARRAAQVWPSRFKSAQDCYVKLGSYEGDPLFAQKLLDSVYGGRMGNAPPPSHDGSTYIGRGGPQWTGREGYQEAQKRTGLPAVATPSVLTRHEAQPEVCAAFWDWKRLNPKADAGDFRGVVKAWNGGYVGFADREERLRGNDPAIARLANVERILPIANALPGEPPSPVPPPEVVDAALEETRKTSNQVKAGAATAAGAGGASEGARALTQQPDAVPLLPPLAAWSAIGVGAALLLVAIYIVVKKENAVIKNWF